MDLLDRYLAAIRSELPAARAQDITDELRAELLDRIEAREAERGRPLDEGELSAMLKAYGPPLAVAGRYREHQYLIGPEAYPYFAHAMRVSAVIVATIFFLSGVLPILTGAEKPVRILLQGLASAATAVFVTFTIVTAIFAVGERYGFPVKRAEAWNPATLPTHVERKKGRWESPIQIGMAVLLLLLWTGIVPLPIPVGHEGRGVRLMPTQVWADHYWPVLILGIASLALALIEWLRPHWNGARIGLGLATRVGWIAALASLYAGRPWFAATSAPEFADRAARSAAGVNSILAIVMIIALISWSLGLAAYGYRLYRRRDPASA